MTPLEALVAARRAGVEVLVEDGKLRLKGRGTPPADILVSLKDHRDQLVEMLTTQSASDRPAQAVGVKPPICRPCGRSQHHPDIVCGPDLCPAWSDPDPTYPIAPAYVPLSPLEDES